MTVCAPFKTGCSFHVNSSGLTTFMASCAIAELAIAINAAATKNFFILDIVPNVAWQGSNRLAAAPKKSTGALSRFQGGFEPSRAWPTKSELGQSRHFGVGPA